jgi:predicted Zn-dependent protease
MSTPMSARHSHLIGEPTPARGESPLLMTADEVITLGRRILDMTTTDFVTVWIWHTVRGVTRVANGRILGGDDGEEFSVTVSVESGKRSPVSVTLDQRDDASLRAAVQQAETIARAQTGDAHNLERIPAGPQEYPAATLWDDETAAALDGARHDIIPRIISTVSGAGFEGAGMVGGIARTRAILRTDGVTAVARETDVECTVTARTADGRASGWSGAATRSWRKLDPVGVANRAAELAALSRNPVAFEPGRRRAILSPAVVAWLVLYMGSAFDGRAVDLGISPLSPPPGSGLRALKRRVFDPRLRFLSDPADPDAGHAPFFDHPYYAGLPMNRITWVDGGNLSAVAYQPPDALRKGRQQHQQPPSVRVEAMPGTALMTIDEMIAHCSDGIFVNRISSIEPIDQRSGMLTGVTRDGCLLIRDGKIIKSLKNFRITDSPFFILNRIEAIGAAERPALGFIPRLADSWPPPPIVVPPIMVSELNFSALSDAV